MEDKCHVAFDFALQKGLSSFDSLPGGGNLDEDSLSAHACMLIESDDPLGPLNSRSLVEGETSIHFS